MKITGFSMCGNAGELSRAVPVFGTSVQFREGLLLKLVDECGNMGFGEASPLPGFSSDNVRMCRKILEEISADFPSWIFDDPEDFPLRMDTLISRNHRIERVPSARFALETAILDLFGKRLGCPVSELLHKDGVPESIPLNHLVDTDCTERELMAHLVSLQQQGVSAVKVKISGDATSRSHQEAQLSLIRRQLGGDVEIRLDANGRLSAEDALSRTEGWLNLGISFIEEPCPVSAWRQIRAAGMAVAADESLASPALCFRILEERLADVLVLKPALLGGLAISLTIARKAALQNMSVLVTHMFDGPVALASCRELAFSLPGSLLACGLVDHEGLSAWPRVLPIRRVNGGHLYRSSVPGIGINEIPCVGAMP